MRRKPLNSSKPASKETLADKETPFHEPDESDVIQPQADDPNLYPDLKEVQAAIQAKDEKKLLTLFPNAKSFDLLIYSERRKKHQEECIKIMHQICDHFPRVFDVIFPTRASLVMFAAKRSQELADIAMDFVLDHKEEVTRLVKNGSDVGAFNSQFANKVRFFPKPNTETFTPEFERLKP